MIRCTLVILTLFFASLSVIAADPTPDDAFNLLNKLKIKYRKDKKGNGITIVDLSRKKITDNDLKTLAALKSVHDLNLSGPIARTSGDKIIYEAKQISDEGLKNIAGMTELRQLTLDGTHVTDAGLKHLLGMKKLQNLVLSDTKVTDSGMETLTKLPALRNLNLLNTKVTETGIGVLKRWKSELKINH